MQIRALLQVVAGGLLLAASSGCGKTSNQATVHGQVTINGQPLEQGSIKFNPLQGTSGVVSGAEIKDGQYAINSKGPTPGRYRVQIDSMRGTGKRRSDPMLPAGQTAEVMENIIPAEFNTASKLEVEIKPGDNQADFAVTSK